MPDKERTEQQKKKLEDERTRLVKELGEFEKPGEYGTDIDSFDEEADEAEEFATRLATAQAIKDRINEIDGVLNKMRMGTYGLCENCRKEISDKILEAMPESKLCEHCKPAKLG